MEKAAPGRPIKADSAAPRVRDRAPSGRSGVLQLQASLGNRAVASLLGSAVQRESVSGQVLQRDPAPSPRMTAGWDKADTRGEGWNAGEKKNVRGSGITRIPVDDVPGGNAQEFASGTEKVPGTDKTYSSEDAEKSKTKESAANRSIVLKPANFAPSAEFDVFLHLHGYTSRWVDPFAGWRQHKKSSAVRDVDQDRIAQQIGAVKNDQVLGILPQGVGHSRFGQLEPYAYVGAVLDRLAAIMPFEKPKGGWDFKLILSGHSGGSATVAKTLRTEVKQSQEAAKKGTAAPGGIAELVLFEAINGSSDYDAITAWVDLRLGQVLSAAPAARDDAIKACPVLRAYRSKDSYVARYDKLNRHIKDWFKDSAKGGQLTAKQRAELESHFKVEVLSGLTGGTGHEKVVGGLGNADQGPIADALKARRKPESSTLLRNPKEEEDKGASPNQNVVPAGVKPSAPKSAAPTIKFGSKARSGVVAPSSLTVLTEVLVSAGLTNATISSTARKPADQARAMYQNLVGSGAGQGVENQRDLYATPGNQVIDVYEELRDKGATPAEIQAGMVAKIEELGPGKVSKHLADPAVLNVFDVSPSSLGNGAAIAAFEKAAKALVGSKIERLLTPGDKDPAEHFEIKPTGGGGGDTADAGPAVTPVVPKAEPVGKAGPATKAVPASKAGPVAKVEPGVKPVPADAQQKLTFIKDVGRSNMEVLSKANREKFQAIDWGILDYPGANPRRINNDAELAWWDAQPGCETYQVTKKRKGVETTVWYARGKHQKEAQELLDAISKKRPGGGERRVNTGANAILTKKQYRTDPAAFDEYIKSQLADPKDVTKDGTRRQLNKVAATAFEKMRDAAKAEGVTIDIRNAFRERKVAEANAKQKANSKAVASYSAHSLGLAMDLNLNVKGLKGKETTTEMPNTIKFLSAPAYKWMFEFGADHGFFQYRNEPWHWEYNPSGFAEKFWAEKPELAPGPEPASK